MFESLDNELEIEAQLRNTNLKQPTVVCKTVIIGMKAGVKENG